MLCSSCLMDLFLYTLLYALGAINDFIQKNTLIQFIYGMSWLRLLTFLLLVINIIYSYDDIESVTKCLNKAYYKPNLPKTLKTTVTSDLESHFRDIIQQTKAFRSLQRTKKQNFDDPTYGGPSLEEFWIQDFCCERPLTDFGGYVPIFIQWVTSKNHKMGDALIKALNGVMRKDVLYVTVSNHAFGIAHQGFNVQDFPNLLVLSAGGNGHVPLPHLKRGIPYQPFEHDLAFKYDISFVGTPRKNGGRKDFLDNIQKQINSIAAKDSDKLQFTITQQPFKESLNIYNSSMISLAPRGVGRTSFRLYEVINVGRLPAYIYSDIPWVPYEGTHADMRSFGWVFSNTEGPQEVVRVARALKSDRADIVRRLEALRRVRDSHYTYEGVKQQILLYLQGGEVKSDLRCHGYPVKG